MILFDWSKVKRSAENKNKNVILIMSTITWPETLPSVWQTRINKYYWKDYSGHSFIINPKRLLVNKYSIPNKTIVEYIMFASKRCLADYLLTGNRNLDIKLAPYIPLDNQLLKITETEVQFKYE